MQLVAEGADTDVEVFGGLGAVAVAGFEGSQDVVFLDFVQGEDFIGCKSFLHSEGRDVRRVRSGRGRERLCCAATCPP